MDEHGLGDYWPKFESCGYTEPSDLEDLKNIGKDNLKETFNIHKPGHFNKLLSVIRKLQYPNQGKFYKPVLHFWGHVAALVRSHINGAMLFKESIEQKKRKKKCPYL